MTFDKMEGMDKEEIKEYFLESVMKTEKEVEKEKRDKKSKSELKIFLVKSLNFSLENFDQNINRLRDSQDLSHNFRKFLDTHRFSVVKLCESVYGLTIHTPEFKKEDDFVIFEEGNYWHVWTLARRYWTKKTIEKLIDHHPDLERTFINPEKLEELTSKDLKEGLENKSHFSGFVAKYKPFYSEKQVSINMYGGTQEDLKTVKEDFGVEPTQITVSMKNSPVNCVLGNLHGNEGFISLSTILEDYFEWGKQIADLSSNLFEKSDKETYEMEELPLEKHEEKGDIDFTRFNSYHAFVLKPQIEENRNPEEIEEIFERILEWFLERKRGYYGYRWDENTYHILRKGNMDSFQLSKEENNLVLYPFDRCSEKTIKEVCKEINENILGDITPIKHSSRPVVRT